MLHRLLESCPVYLLVVRPSLILDLYRHTCSSHENRFVLLHCRGKDVTPDYDNVASVVFSSPQVAKVGMNETDAIEKIKDIDVYTSTFS